MLTPEKLEELANAHINRVLDHASMSDVMALARQAMEWSLMKQPGVYESGYDRELLCTDIMAHEGEDADSASEFIAGLGWPDELIDEFLSDS